MAQIEDCDSMDFELKRSLLARSKRAMIVKGPAGVTEYRCVECPIGFTEKTDMEKHLAVHNKEYRFLCGICGTALKRKEHLDRHTLEHQEVRPHVCPDCGKAFKRKEHLNIHRTIHSGEKNHTCPLCDKSFYRKDHLQKHLQTHNKMFIEQNIYPVSDQELMGIKQEAMDEDGEGPYPEEVMLEISHAVPIEEPPDPERPHACPVCAKRFKRKDHLKLHCVSHLPRDKPCPDCGKAFRTDQQLHNHMMIHVKPYASPAVSEEQYAIDDEFTMEQEDPLLVPRVSMGEVDLEEYAAAPREERPYSCKICSRSFKRKQHLKVHANVHARMQPPTIWCSICSEGFFNNEQFESHSCMGAEGEAPPRANQENNPGAEVVQIVNVPIVAEGDALPVPVPRRVFVCRYCGKPFKRKDHYRIHLHVHTGLKSFFCDHCGKGFYRKDHLQKHSQVHTKARPPQKLATKPKREMPELFPIHMLSKAEHVKPEITITAPSNTKLRVPLQIKVPYQVVMSMDNGEQRAVTVDPRRDLLS